MRAEDVNDGMAQMLAMKRDRCQQQNAANVGNRMRQQVARRPKGETSEAMVWETAGEA